jgi:uncharacterized protein (UPF0335 family)
VTDSIAGERLRSFITRIERLDEEKQTIAGDIREVFAEAKSSGFDPKIMRQVLRLRKMETAERQEQEALLETYLAALGMLPLEQEVVAAGGENPAEASLQRRARKKAPADSGRDFKRKVGKTVRKAMDAMGTPVEPTADEKAKGVKAAWIDKSGTRVSLATGVTIDG